MTLRQDRSPLFGSLYMFRRLPTGSFTADPDSEENACKRTREHQIVFKEATTRRTPHTVLVSACAELCRTFVFTALFPPASTKSWSVEMACSKETAAETEALDVITTTTWFESSPITHVHCAGSPPAREIKALISLSVITALLGYVSVIN